MRFGTVIRWWGCRGGRSRRSIGSGTRSPFRRASRSDGYVSTWRRRRSFAGASGRRVKKSPTRNSTTSGTTRATRSTRCGSTATSPSPRSSRRRSRSSERRRVSNSPAPSPETKPSATRAGWRSNVTPTHPSRPFTGRSSSPRCSTGRTRASTRSLGTHRSRARTPSRPATLAAIPTGSRLGTKRVTATRTLSRTSSGGPSIWCGRAARSA